MVDATAAGADFEWEPPGDGQWWSEQSHWPAPVTPLFAEIFPGTFDGLVRRHARYGIAIVAGRFRPVNGWYYYSSGTLGPTDAEAPEAVAADALERRTWMQEPARWTDVERPALLGRNRSLQAEDLATVDDAGLADHFLRCIANFEAAAPIHFEHLCYYIAVGLLVEAVEAHGIAGSEVATWLAGSSPATAAAGARVQAIADALHASGVTEIADLDAVRAAGPAAAAALDSYLADYGCHILGNDLSAPTLAECPDAVVSSIRATIRATVDRSAAAAPAGDGGILDRIPAAERPAVEIALAEARACYGVRDDDNATTFIWPLGLLRRALIEIGRRAAARGALADPAHVLEAGSAAAVALLSGADADGPAAWAARAERRARAAQCRPPSPIGTPRAAAPSSTPRRAHSARVAALAARYWVEGLRSDGALHGVGVGTETYRGRACVVQGAIEALDRLQPGDVLVTTTTSPSFNTVLPAAGALVVQEGGLMSHAAILARELGLPAVIGVTDVHDHVRDGDLIEVDPVAGVVRVLAARSTTPAR